MTQLVGRARPNASVNSESGSLETGPVADISLVCVWFDVTLVPTLRRVQLGERVGAKLEHAVLHAVALVFAAAHCALHHQVRSLPESTSIFGKSANVTTR